MALHISSNWNGAADARFPSGISTQPYEIAYLPSSSFLFFVFFFSPAALKRQESIRARRLFFIAENDALQLALNCRASVIASAVKERSQKRYHIETQLGVTSLLWAARCLYRAAHNVCVAGLIWLNWYQYGKNHGTCQRSLRQRDAALGWFGYEIIRVNVSEHHHRHFAHIGRRKTVPIQRWMHKSKNGNMI